MRATARTRVFAVLGDPVRHSLSPVMHNAAFRILGLNAVYIALHCEPGELAPVMRALARGGGGGNVTVPHKAEALAALDRAGPLAVAAGACNTFWGTEGQLAGDNTDVTGVVEAMAALGAPATAWLVAGTGGSARAVAEAASRLGARLAVRSRDAARGREFLAWAEARGVAPATAEEAEVLVNATPLGLRGADPMPFPPHVRRGVSHALDLVYAAGGTPWVRALRAAGVRAEDGRLMLLAQGAAGFELWFPGTPAPREAMHAALRRALG
ncbi:MAG TPA: shikimate dehydrogenase [Gemmatimonadales bacterium]|nr:shikimate dehydrogenase [Gemmatimonadales bacterium]